MVAKRGGQDFNIGLVSIVTSSEIHSTYIVSGPVFQSLLCLRSESAGAGGRFRDGREGGGGVRDATTEISFHPDNLLFKVLH